MDSQNSRKTFQKAIRRLCELEAKAHRRLDQSKCRMSSSTVSDTIQEPILLYFFKSQFFFARELSMYFAQMCRYIDITKDEYFGEMRKHETDIKTFGSILTHSKILRFLISSFFFLN